MPATSPDLAALIGSRICHDLVSPLGAIGNGLELLAMTAAGSGPEVALIAESAANANARIRFFRLAYGAAAATAPVAETEIRSILGDWTRGGRLAVDWQLAGAAPRPQVKLAFLALQCLETALPYGGQIVVRRTGDGLEAEARAERLKVEEALWANLRAETPDPSISAAQVQFALLPAEAAAQGRSVDWSKGDGRLTLSF